VQVVLGQLVGVVQICIIAVALASDRIAAALGLHIPQDWQTTLNDKRAAICMGAWFLGNTLRNGLLYTGAFEVYYDDQILFSRLATDRMPTLADIFEGIQETITAAQ
jgi:thioredoxin reductase-like selenoprotein T